MSERIPTHAEVVAALGCASSTAYAKLRGERPVVASEVVAIADSTGIDAGWLVRELARR